LLDLMAEVTGPYTDAQRTAGRLFGEVQQAEMRIRQLQRDISAAATRHAIEVAELEKHLDYTLATLERQGLDSPQLRAMAEEGSLSIQTGHAVGRDPGLMQTKLDLSVLGLRNVDERALELLRAARMEAGWTDGSLNTLNELSYLKGPI